MLAVHENQKLYLYNSYRENVLPHRSIENSVIVTRTYMNENKAYFLGGFFATFRRRRSGTFLGVVRLCLRRRNDKTKNLDKTNVLNRVVGTKKNQ